MCVRHVTAAASRRWCSYAYAICPCGTVHYAQRSRRASLPALSSRPSPLCVYLILILLYGCGSLNGMIVNECVLVFAPVLWSLSALGGPACMVAFDIRWLCDSKGPPLFAIPIPFRTLLRRLRVNLERHAAVLRYTLGYKSPFATQQSDLAAIWNSNGKNENGIRYERGCRRPVDL
jgi:hypothetical protein